MTFDVESLKVTENHKALAAFIKAESGKSPSAATVALVLTLAPEYRKSEAYQAEKAARDAEKAAAEQARRARKQERLQKALNDAARLAAELGIELPEAVVPADPEPVVLAKGAVTAEDVVKAPAKRKTAGNKASTLVAVPDVADVSPGDAPEDTSALIVVESEDVFAEVGASESEDDFADDDFADDDGDVEDY